MTHWGKTLWKLMSFETLWNNNINHNTLSVPKARDPAWWGDLSLCLWLRQPTTWLAPAALFWYLSTKGLTWEIKEKLKSMCEPVQFTSCSLRVGCGKISLRRPTAHRHGLAKELHLSLNLLGKTQGPPWSQQGMWDVPASSTEYQCQAEHLVFGTTKTSGNQYPEKLALRLRLPITSGLFWASLWGSLLLECLCKKGRRELCFLPTVCGYGCWTT